MCYQSIASKSCLQQRENSNNFLTFPKGLLPLKKENAAVNTLTECLTEFNVTTVTNTTRCLLLWLENVFI